MSNAINQDSSGIRAAVGILTGLLVTTVILGLFSAWMEMDSRRFSVTMALVIPATVTLVAPIVTAMMYRPYNIFHTLNFIAMSFFFGVFGRVIFVLNAKTDVAQELLEGYPVEALIPGAMLSALGSFLLCSGFVVTGNVTVRSRLLSDLFSKMNPQGLTQWLPVLMIIAAGATYLFLQATGFQYSGIASLSSKRRVIINGVESSMGYHRLLAQDMPRMVLLVLVAVWFWPYRRTLWLRISLGVFAILAVVLPFMASSRAKVLIAGIAVCVVINQLRGIRLSSLIGAFVLSLVILTGMLALRRENNQGIAASESIKTLGLEPIFGNKSFSCVVKLSHVYQSVPDVIDYKYGQTYLSVFFAPIPRAIWENKPAIRMGREITEKVYNRGLDLRDKGGGTPPGLFAEAIINFSIYLFPIFIFLMGCGLRILDNSLLNLAKESAAGVALYAGVIPGFCHELMGGDFTSAMIQGLSVGGAIVLICAISRLLLLPRRLTANA